MRIGFPSTLTHEMVGAGLPLARQLSMMCIPSLASVSELLSSSNMSGGTAGRKREKREWHDLTVFSSNWAIWGDLTGIGRQLQLGSNLRAREATRSIKETNPRPSIMLRKSRWSSQWFVVCSTTSFWRYYRLCGLSSVSSSWYPFSKPPDR